jgi:hypothetical protein
MRALRASLFTALLVLVSMGASCPDDRYSADPAASRIQHLTDFCLGYGALRDGATNFIKVDTQRTNPVLTVDMITAYQTARTFIKPYCSATFDPVTTPFDLNTLNDQLLAIRLILLAKENE